MFARHEPHIFHFELADDFLELAQALAAFLGIFGGMGKVACKHDKIGTRADLTKQSTNSKVVVFTHRPLFDLYPSWDWTTADGAQAIKILLQHPNVTVFYGHIHQENHHMTGHIAHHAAKSLMFPLPAPGSQPKRVPLPWNATAPYAGLGFREVEAEVNLVKYDITEFPVVRS